MHNVDIIFLAHGRPEFTKVSLVSLLKNTRWQSPFIRSFTVYTDGEEFFSAPGGPAVISPPVTDKLGGPVAVLNHAIQHSTADFICKIDNDTMVPLGWLDYCMNMLERHRDVDFLGLEAWARDASVFPEKFELNHTKAGIRKVSHIGGIGFYRRACLLNDLPTPNGRFGLTEWQWVRPSITKAFLEPPLPVFLLDHMPTHPWMLLSKQYEDTGVQRPSWGKYPIECYPLWSWFTESKIGTGGAQ